MANRRMLSKSISTSIKVNALDEFSQLLFTWIIPHTDDFGRMDGESEVVKALVMPMSKRKVDDFSRSLTRMAEIGLIKWYRVDKKSVIEVINFDDHQSNLVHKRTQSKFPDQNHGPDNFQEILGTSKKYHSNLTELNLTELNLTQPNPPVAEKGESEFDNFWEAYPKKVSKGQAKRTWKKLNPTEQLLGKILTALERAKTSDQWVRDDGRFIPNPATWLNAEGWEDQHIPAQARASPGGSTLEDWKRVAEKMEKEAANG